MVEILVGLFAATAVSGIVPLVNAELLVLAAAAAVPAAGVPLVALVSTVGQMVTKGVLFGLARWAPGRLPQRAQEALEKPCAAVRERGKTVGTLMFTSAATGIPPFYGVSLAAGAVGVNLAGFLITGSLGRFVRFGVLAWLGHTLGEEAADLLASSSFSLFGLG